MEILNLEFEAGAKSGSGSGPGLERRASGLGLACGLELNLGAERGASRSDAEIDAKTPKKPLLIVIVGPTGVGKSALAVDLAVRLGGLPILSCDSRQFYRQMSIGTAVPSDLELAQARHYFIHDRSVEEPLDAGSFEREALDLLGKLYAHGPQMAVMVGGSGMYVDAVCKGFDELPQASACLRELINSMTHQERLVKLQDLDPEYFEVLDTNNTHRVQRALEVCLSGEKKYSELRTGKIQERDFEIVKIGVNMSRKELYDRINHRVDLMLEQGLLQEAIPLYRYAHLSSLQTVGYREIFDYMDHKITLPEAIELIKRNSRRYAKRQITWFFRDETIKWFAPTEIDQVLRYINEL